MANKQLNSDSQRLALSLRVEFSVYAAHLLIGLHGLPLLSTIAPADNSGSDSSSTFGV